MNTLLFATLLIQILLFTVFVLINKRDNKVLHYLTLLTLCSITVFNMFAYNTDAEDVYIALRYITNFVDGNGLVFNTFDKVEGYSDFLWVMLIATIYKISDFDLPSIARYLGLVTSIIVVLYTYYLSFKITQNKLLSYLASFIVSVSGSFACYGLSGFESPLFAFLILFTINFVIKQQWICVGLLIALITMTRPEGVIISIPILIWVIMQEHSSNDKIKNIFIIGFASLIILLPWTLWRVSYYGYIIPNTIAAKQGMGLSYQLKIGIIYFTEFLISNFTLFLILALPICQFRSIKKWISILNEDKSHMLVIITSFVFIMLYIYAGGDWMPEFRFYSSLIPLFSIMVIGFWRNYELRNPIPFSKIHIVFIITFSGVIQLNNSFTSVYSISSVKSWNKEVEGLKVIGKWFKLTLPPNTLLASFPNGAFSYYNELPTIDIGGLTDTQVGRYGVKRKTGGMAGHISSNWPYVLSKKPDIIAIMRGQGFEREIESKPASEGYTNASFEFTDYFIQRNFVSASVNYPYVNIQIRTDRKEDIIRYLLSVPNIRLVNNTE